MKRLLSLLLFFAPVLPAVAGKGPAAPSPLAVYEDSLKGYGRQMFHGTDLFKAMANRKFTELLEKALSLDGSFQYPFDSLNFIGRLKPEDESFRIYNWNIPKADGTTEYFAYIQTWNEKTKQAKVYKLQNKNREIRNPETARLGPDKWYGTLYYKIIQNTYKKKRSYTLLGWDANSNVTWRKVLDVLTFAQDGTPQFGDDIFQVGKRFQNRVIFEFKAEMTMTLRWDDDRNMIVYDHLVPEFEGMTNPPPQFLINSFSYDGYTFKKGKWNYVDDIDARNHKDKKDSKYIKPIGS